jgi:hypothetical protein
LYKCPKNCIIKIIDVTCEENKIIVFIYAEFLFNIYTSRNTSALPLPLSSKEISETLPISPKSYQGKREEE